MRTSKFLLLCASILTMLLVSACDSGEWSKAEAAPSDTLDGGGKLIVAFMPTAASAYVSTDIDAIKETAAEYNYETIVFQNNFDQAEQDQQVQQFLATGQKPEAIIWWPTSVEASVNSIRQLSRVAPVIQMNQAVSEETEQYVTAYAGANDTLIGQISGELAMQAREEDLAAGRTLHSPGGNLIEFSFPSSYKAGDFRHDAFMEATAGAPFNLLRNEPATGTLDAADGFNHASQVLPMYLGVGVDYIYSHNFDMGSGIVEALRQNGLEPGRDVTVIGGSCSRYTEPILDGTVYAAVAQPPAMEGRLVARTVVQYLASGEVTDGSVIAEPTPEIPELEVAPIAAQTYLPAVPLTKDNLPTLTIWGLSGPKLCS